MANEAAVQPHVRVRGRGRVRRVAKWGGLVVSLLIAGMFVASFISPVGGDYCQQGAGPGRVVTLFSAGGGVCVEDFRGNIPPAWSGWTWNSADTGDPPFHVWPQIKWVTGYKLVLLPLWLPFLLTGLPTAILFYRDRPAARRARKGKCITCGYDLRGLTPGAPCPECGRAESESA